MITTGKKKTPDNFGAGVVCAHLGIAQAYLTFLKDRKQDNVIGIAGATILSIDRIALVPTVPGALDAWHLFASGVPDGVPQLSLLGNGLPSAIATRARPI